MMTPREHNARRNSLAEYARVKTILTASVRCVYAKLWQKRLSSFRCLYYDAVHSTVQGSGKFH